MNLSRLYKEIFRSERLGGLLLIGMTIISLVISNCSFGNNYITFWHRHLAGEEITFWINEVGMSIFFLLIGLELKRELYQGELSSMKNALFPLTGAIGGMLVPAFIYFMLNRISGHLSGTGIPMATDIAFAIGVLSLVGRRVPASLKIFLTALAVADDLGAIIVIALFYNSAFQISYLLLALLVFLWLMGLNRFRVNWVILYFIGGLALWYCIWKSGIHPSIAGVLLAVAIPYESKGRTSMANQLQHVLHLPVSFFILPVFALANTCIVLNDSAFSQFYTPESLGVFFGLVIGKPAGILLFCYTGCRLKCCKRPDDLQWKSIAAAGLLAGIGFTMSIFITLLAYNDQQFIQISKLAILSASLVSGIVGLFLLSVIFKNRRLNN